MAMSNAYRKLMDVVNGMRKLLSHKSFLLNVNRMMMPDHEVPLHKAMCNADLGVGKALLEYDVDKDDKGFTPLHLAAQQGDVGVVEELLQLKGPSQLALADGAANTSVHLTSESGHCEEEILLEPAANEVNINGTNNDGNTPLHLAADEGHVGVVKVLLQRGAKPSLAKKNGGGNTPLHLAADDGHVEVVNLLLNHYAEPSLAEKNGDGNTPLHLAAEKNGDGNTPLHLAAEKNGDGNTPLHLAADEGHVGVVEVLLQQTTLILNLNEKNGDGNTPLHLAADEGHVGVVKLLLNYGAESSLAEKNGDGNTPLHLAADEGQVGVVEMLIQLPTFMLNLHEKNGDGNTPLHLAADEGHVGVVNLLLNCGAQPNHAEKNGDGNTPLHLAADEGHVGVVEVLLQQTTLILNLNEKNGDGNTPLHLAADEGHVGVVEVLLQQTTLILNLNEKNGDGNTPLHLAADEGHVGVVEVLLQQTTLILNLNEKNGDGNTPLHLAADEGHVGVVNLLLNYGAEPSLAEKNGDGNTPLHLAADEGHVEVVNLLLNNGTKPRLAEKNGDGNTPLHLASKEGHEEVVGAVLLSEYVNKSILNAIDGDGNTPLHLATKNGHANVVTKMLEDAPSRFDLNAKNKNGHTPLHFATRKCHLHIVKALCSMGQQLLANLKDGSGKTCLQYAKDQQDDNIKLQEIANILTERPDVKDFLDRQYRHRQDFIDAANALLVGGALIAGITFASWLTPPLGYITYYQFHQSSPGTPANTFEAFAGLEMHYSLRIFWVFNTLSFFFAIATIISGAKAAFPDLDTVFIVDSLRSVRTELQWTSILLLCAVVTVLGSFVCAGFAILPPIQRDVRNMKISAVIGLVICSWTIIKFLMKLFRTVAKVFKEYKATSRKQQTKDENLWVWLLQSVKFMQKPRGDEDEEMEVTAATHLNTGMGSHLLVITSNKSSQCVKYIGEGVSDYAGAIQGNGPARHPRRRYYYFEITIKDCGFDGRIGIGFTDEDFKNYRQTGWESNSYGYHGNDGALFKGTFQGSPFGPKFSTHDIVGAGIDHLKQEIFFTKNGELVGHCIPNEVRDTLYPTIGLHSHGAKVEVNFRQQKFKYDFDLNAKL